MPTDKRSSEANAISFGNYVREGQGKVPRKDHGDFIFTNDDLTKGFNKGIDLIKNASEHTQMNIFNYNLYKK